LSVVEDKRIAIAFYESLRFCRTSEREGGELAM
jgi:hypothetical protein